MLLYSAERVIPSPFSSSDLTKRPELSELLASLPSDAYSFLVAGPSQPVEASIDSYYKLLTGKEYCADDNER